jgi:hypothetical protein
MASISHHQQEVTLVGPIQEGSHGLVHSRRAADPYLGDQLLSAKLALHYLLGSLLDKCEASLFLHFFPDRLA